jgi:hypothetical protein
MTSATIEEKASLWSAVLLFSVTYLLVSAVVTGVLMAFDLDSNTGVSVGLLMAATAVAARKFVIDHRRPLNRGEQVRFTLMATAAMAVITLIQVAVVVPIYFSTAELPQLIAESKAWAADNAVLLSVISLVVLLLTLIILYLASGWFSRWFDKRLAATGKI